VGWNNYIRGENMQLKLKNTALVLLVISSTHVYAQGTGLEFDEKAYRAVPEEERPLGFGENLPASTSLRKFAPSVAHQGNFGTCVGWSSTYYAATIEYARLSGITAVGKVNAQAFDPYYTYLNITEKADYFSCAEGTLITNAAEFIKARGLKRFNYNSLECGAKIDVSNLPGNVPMRVTDFRRLIDKKDADEENIVNVKQALVDGHPVIIGMALPKSFYSVDSTGLFKPDPSEKQFIADYGGHAMAVIGYNDQLHGGVFEIVNSWGDDWGDKGFVYVRYDDFVSYTRMGIRYETELVTLTENKGCVIGNCENGYGRLVYDDNNMYEGNFVSGERVGYGLFYWESDQSSFGGEWYGSKRHGKGQLLNSNGEKQQGFWKEDIYVKNEIVINPIISGQNSSNIRDNLKFLTLKEISGLLGQKPIVDSIIAGFEQGCIYGDCKNGEGVLLGQNYIYCGSFQNGLRHGYGEMRWTGESWGNSYLGNSESNVRTGIGAYFWPNGNKYYGEWQGGNRNGLGAFFNSNGDIQAGSFENNNFISEGLGFGNGTQAKVLEDPANSMEIKGDKSTAPSLNQVKPTKKNKKKKS
jgi:hypothetical protein